MTTLDAARRLGVPAQQLYELIAGGQLSGVRDDRGRVTVDLEAARSVLDLGPEASADVEPLDAVREAALDIAEATERRDRAILAAYEPPQRLPLGAIAEAAKLSVEGVRGIVTRMGGELRQRGRPAKSGS